MVQIMKGAAVNPEIVKRVKSFRSDHCHEKTTAAYVKATSAYSFTLRLHFGRPVRDRHGPTEVWILEHDL